MTLSTSTVFCIALVGMLAGMALKSWLQQVTLTLSIESRSAIKVGESFFYLISEAEFISKNNNPMTAASIVELAHMEELSCELRRLLKAIKTMPPSHDKDFTQRLLSESDQIVSMHINERKAAR